MTPSLARFAVIAIAAMTVTGHAFAAEAPACATPEQAEQVQDYYKMSPTLPFIAARELAMTDAVIASAMPKTMAVGTSGAAFPQVWEAAKGLDGMILIVRDGNVFEIHSKVVGGALSTRSKYFNLNNEGQAFSGHLRPDNVAWIYALTIPGENNTASRVISFMNRAGETTYSIALGGEGRDAPPEARAQFEKVVAVIKAQPAACK